MTTEAPGVSAVLFDATGTLIETREPVGETYARIAREYGVALPAWRLQDAFSRVLRGAPPCVGPEAAPAEIEARERAWWRDVVRATFRATDGSVRFSDFEACFERLFGHFARADAWRARPGAAGALERLRTARIPTGVVSNFDRRLRGILDGLGLAARLDVVVLPSDAGAAKPDPRIFALALERLGAPAARAVYVGDDRERDLAGARAAGLRAIDVGALATLDELPDRIVPKPQESA